MEPKLLMKQAIRVVVLIVVAFATHYFTFYILSIPFMAVLEKHQWLSVVPILGSLLCATIAARYIWRHTGTLSQGSATRYRP